MKDDELRRMLYNLQGHLNHVEPGNEGIRTRLPLFTPNRERDNGWRDRLRELELKLTEKYPAAAELIRAVVRILHNAGI